MVMIIIFRLSSKFQAYLSKVFSADFVESNWKKVVTLKTEHDNLILCSFSDSTGSFDK